MESLIYYILLIGMLIWLNGCKGPSPSNKIVNPITEQSSINPYITQYEGGYMVEVRGISNQTDAELYVLHDSGAAKWMWIKVQNGQTQILSEKWGSWTAAINSIKITIKGNTGDLVEQFNLVNGKFVNGDRSLTKTK